MSERVSGRVLLKTRVSERVSGESTLETQGVKKSVNESAFQNRWKKESVKKSAFGKCVFKKVSVGVQKKCFLSTLEFEK